MDGCARQNPAYRSAKGKPRLGGAFLFRLLHDRQRQQRSVVRQVGEPDLPAGAIPAPGSADDRDLEVTALIASTASSSATSTSSMPPTSFSRIAITPTDEPSLRPWRKRLFVLMARNAASPIDAFRLPSDRTVMVGSQVAV
jgi:KUP system potassium uptake protein